MTTICEIVSWVTKMRFAIQKKNFPCINHSVFYCYLFNAPVCTGAKEPRHSKLWIGFGALDFPLPWPSVTRRIRSNAESKCWWITSSTWTGIALFVRQRISSWYCKTSYWIQKAADQHLPLAQFNLAFYWWMATSWMESVRSIQTVRAAAEQDVPEAIYVMGLMYTEELLVPRSWSELTAFLKKHLNSDQMQQRLQRKKWSDVAG